MAVWLYLSVVPLEYFFSVITHATALLTSLLDLLTYLLAGPLMVPAVLMLLASLILLASLQFFWVMLL